jgi:hypothetical protein
MSRESQADEMLDSVATLLRRATEGSETVFDIKEEDGIRRVEIIRREAAPELPELRREPLPLDRPQRRNHIFHDHLSFAAYVAREAKGEDSLILADASSEVIRAVLRESYTEQPEFVLMKPTIHPMFEPWLAILDKRIPVLQFGLFCARNRSTIVEPPGRQVALTFQQIKMAKTIEVNRGVGAKALNGIVIQTDIGGKSTSDLVEIPESIKIECPVYIGSYALEIVLDVLITGEDDEVVVYVTCPLLAARRNEAFESFVLGIREALGPGYIVGLGSVKHAAWDTIDQPRR